jgi:hypothetical protein
VAQLSPNRHALIDQWSQPFLVFVLQIMDSHRQLSQSTRLNCVFSILKVSYRALGNSGLSREKLGGGLFCFSPNLI